MGFAAVQYKELMAWTMMAGKNLSSLEEVERETVLVIWEK